MLINQNNFEITLSSVSQAYFDSNNCLFFDIETNGFSPDISNVYLIGCLYYKNDRWQMTQWFANDYISEKALLISFFDFMESFTVLIHYNGTGFDIPYLQKKCIQHGLSYNFNAIQSFDLYKKLSFLKKVLSLPNVKQQTIETYAGFIRKDPYSGGELIQVYSKYMQCNLLSKPCESYLTALYLHNAEDLLGLFHSCGLLSYLSLFSGDFTVVSSQLRENTYEAFVSLTYPLSKDFSIAAESFEVHVSFDAAQFLVHTYHGCLKHFYSDYKNYFYLPKEDMAVHKSIAAYVDKDFREKAKATTCYLKKEGQFLPQFKEIVTPFFQKDYKTEPIYFEMRDTFLKDFTLQCQYISHLLHSL